MSSSSASSIWATESDFENVVIKYVMEHFIDKIISLESNFNDLEARHAENEKKCNELEINFNELKRKYDLISPEAGSSSTNQNPMSLSGSILSIQLDKIFETSFSSEIQTLDKSSDEASGSSNLESLKVKEKDGIEKTDMVLFKCTLCRNTFLAAKFLARHMQVRHQNQKPAADTDADVNVKRLELKISRKSSENPDDLQEKVPNKIRKKEETNEIWID